MSKTKAQPTQPIDLTTAQVADKIERSTDAALGLIHRGHFPNARKLPGKTATYLIPVSDVEHYLEVREARKRRKSASNPQVD